VIRAAGVAAAGLVLALAAGCGSTAGSAGNAPLTVQRAPSIGAVASQIGCTPTTVQTDSPDDTDTAAYQSGSCTIWKAGAQVEIAVFTSPNQQHAWEMISKAEGFSYRSGLLWDAAVTGGSSSPASPEAQGSITQCTARIEADNANGDIPYSGAEAHDPRLPAPCRPLSSDQLLKALNQAVKDMQSGG
jgi:hypothetical protein